MTGMLRFAIAILLALTLPASAEDIEKRKSLPARMQGFP
jgi:hypothetical protein